MQEIETENNSTPNFFLKFFKIKLLIFAILILLVSILLYVFLFSVPSSFKDGTVFEVEPGMSLTSISAKLKKENIIRSRFAFEAFAILLGGEKRIKSSSYLFEGRPSVYDVAKWIVKGERYMAPIVVTIPEGFNKYEIANAYALKMKTFNKEVFLEKSKEGYMFPDTYYFFTGDDEMDVIDSMKNNFDKKFNPVVPEISASGKQERDIIIMASILEKEAKGDSDREIISGILWKRLSKAMPLQVDAAPITYKEKGLPKEPIGNPGLEAIKAAIYPESSPYLYYIHGKDGNTYYAKTFEEHKKNIAKYLK